MAVNSGRLFALVLVHENLSPLNITVLVLKPRFHLCVQISYVLINI